MASSKTFCELVGNQLKALEFEQQALSVGSEFLPEIARRVRDGETTKGEDLSGYWRWLTGQWVEAQEGE